MLLASGFAASAALASAQSGPLPPDPPDAAAEARSDLAYHEAIFTNPQNPPDVRAGAAWRLVRLGESEAFAVLAEALAIGDAPSLLAVVDALSRVPRLPEALRDPAVEALRTAPAEAIDRLSAVVSRYGEQARARVAAIALSPDLSAAERLGCIRALAAFSDRESGDALVHLIDPDRRETEAVRTAAFESLRRMTALEIGDDYAAWVEAWRQARDRPAEERAAEMVPRYRERLVVLEKANDRLAAQFVELLREHYRRLDVEEQLSRLGSDLDDALPEVRGFAMERIGRLLRDSVRIPDGLRAGIVRTLRSDESATLRLQAAQLLDELAQPDLATLLAERLDDETDRTALLGYLELLRQEPTSAALGWLVDHLIDETLGPPSAAVLWQLVQLTSLDLLQQHEVRRAVRHALNVRLTPHVLQLGALVGDNEDLGRFMRYLDDADPAMRAAVAEGLMARGLRQPLLDRVGDDAIYPFVVRDIARGPADLTAFQKLVELTPREATRDEWEQAVRELASRLSVADLLVADRMLLESPASSPQLRQTILMRGAVGAAEGSASGTSEDLLARLALLLIELGEPLRAYELLEPVAGSRRTEIAELRFRAAVLAGRYDDAEHIADVPAAWVAIMGALVDHDAAGAKRLQEEIARRFAGRLEGDVAAAFDAASARLDGRVAPTDAPGTPPVEPGVEPGVEPASPPDEGALGSESGPDGAPGS